MFDILTNYSIPEFVRDLLKKRFPGDRLKQTVHDAGDKLNFACPYCGDSKTDSKKKRGNLYPERGFYKCYNDGCSIKVDTAKFVSKYAQTYGLEIPSVKAVEPQWVHNTSKKKKGSLIELLINRNIGSSLLEIDYLVSRFSLTPCKEADFGSRIGQFVESRGLKGIPTFDDCCYFDSSQNKVYLFNVDLKSKKILGFAIRRLDQVSGPKYLIKNYAELKKNGLVPSLNDEVIGDIDSLNNYFNVFNVDFTKPVFVTEGQIDAMFLQNAIATTGVSKSKLLLENLLSKNSALIFFDSDLAGKKQSIELIKKGYRVFLWSKVMNDLKIKYKADRFEVSLIKDVNDLFQFIHSREEGFGFDEFNSFVLDYFSESPLDLILV
jgi:hypothetical protein